MRNLPLTLLRLLACLLCLAVAAPPKLAVASPIATALTAPSHAAAAEEKDERQCRRGKDTKKFGWKVVDFGVYTLRFLIGLLIIPIGLFLVCVGVILEVVEAVAC
jgi:hypothetical protein